LLFSAQIFSDPPVKCLPVRIWLPPLPPLTARHWYLSFRILNNLRLPWKTELPWNFSLCWNIFTIHWIFDQLCACPKNRVCSEIFHCIEYAFHIQDFWATCACPEKTESALKSLYWIYAFYHSEFWTTWLCPEKQSLACTFSNSLHWNILYLTGFLSNLRLPRRQSLPWNFSLHGIYVLHSGFFSNLRLPWKAEFALNSLYWIYYFLCFRILNNLCLPWKTEFALEFFTVIKYFISFRIFEQLALSLKTEFALKIFIVLNMLCRLHSVFLSNLRLPWRTECALKNRVCPEKFHCIQIRFIFHDFLAICACSENRVCPEIFKPGGRQTSPTPRLVRHWTHRYTNFCWMVAGMMFNLRLDQGACLRIKTRFRFTVLMKQGQRFGVVCQTETSATRKCFAALICTNIWTHMYTNFCWTIAGMLFNLRLNEGAIFAH